MSPEPRDDRPNEARDDRPTERFRRALAQHMGLRFDEDKSALLAEVMAARMRATNARDADAYVARIGSSGTEVGSLARMLSVGETYFFRDGDQFRALDAILRERVARDDAPVRLLSAGCASGEEPYSLAMLVRDTLPAASAARASITAFDINPDAVARAREGRYGRWSLRATSQDLEEKYLRAVGNEFAVRDDIRPMVRFEERNLDRPDPGFWRPEAFDIIFCRNVLMYFTPDAARRVVARFARSLVPGGYLFLGHAENLRGISGDFKLVHEHDTFYYRRCVRLGEAETEPVETTPARKATAPPRPTPAAAAPPVAQESAPLAESPSWLDAITSAAGRIGVVARRPRNGSAAPRRTAEAVAELDGAEATAARSDLGPALALFEGERYREALCALPGGADAHSEDPDVLLFRAVLQMGAGAVETAEACCRELLRIDDLNAGAHYVMALCRDHAGDRTAAIEHDRIALYLDAEFAMPHLHVGLMARRCGDTGTARRELALARGLLSREDAARLVLFGGGFERRALIALCDAELNACAGRT